MRSNQSILTWHTAKKRPELWKEVLVHFADTDAYIVAEAGRDAYDSLVWWTLDRNYDISPSDRWHIFIHRRCQKELANDRRRN